MMDWLKGAVAVCAVIVGCELTVEVMGILNGQPEFAVVLCWVRDALVK